MRFGRIDTIILFGGSRCTAELAADILEKGVYGLSLYTAARQLADPVFPGGETFGGFLERRGIPYVCTEDINAEADLPGRITPGTLGLGLGEAWSFSPELIARFGGRLLDLMGVRLPQYRGGAHYTWQILRRNRIGCCNLQVINEEMIQGVFDSGEIVCSREYLFPASARIPADYFDFAVEQEIAFIKRFLEDVARDTEFQPFRLQENFSLYFPRLNTDRNGLIDWSWDTQDIETFVCAFDEPYAGASTWLNGERVRLKSVRAEYNDGPFHPFQCGLVVKVHEGAAYIATRQGTIVAERVLGADGADAMGRVRTGMRFFTPREKLEEAMLFSPEYGASGLKG
jgi:hypothetical protein